MLQIISQKKLSDTYNKEFQKKIQRQPVTHEKYFDQHLIKQNKTIIKIKNIMRGHHYFMFNIFKFIYCTLLYIHLHTYIDLHNIYTWWTHIFIYP